MPGTTNAPPRRPVAHHHLSPDAVPGRGGSLRRAGNGSTPAAGDSLSETDYCLLRSYALVEHLRQVVAERADVERR